MPVLEAQSLSKRFGQNEAVRDFTLTVAAHEVVTLVGESGSGKTSALRMLNGLLEPSGGRVLLAGEDIRAIPGHLLRRRIGYVFQGIGLFPHLCVADNVGITPRLLQWSRARIDSRVDELLGLVGLEPEAFRARLPSELSGGQAQRVAVARALAAEPELVLLDEPFGALDASTRRALQTEFLSLRQKLGFSAVLVTHDAVEALTLGDRVGVMARGALLQLGSARELVDTPISDEVAALCRAPLESARTLLEDGADVRS